MVAPPSHRYPDWNSELTEIDYDFEIGSAELYDGAGICSHLHMNPVHMNPWLQWEVLQKERRNPLSIAQQSSTHWQYRYLTVVFLEHGTVVLANVAMKQSRAQMERNYIWQNVEVALYACRLLATTLKHLSRL